MSKLGCSISTLSLCLIFLEGCSSSRRSIAPSIEFTVVPQTTVDDLLGLKEIAGRVKGARPGQRIVLFTKSGAWWVQPFRYSTFTAINKDSTWSNKIHLGTDYGALLVDAAYLPPMNSDTLPAVGNGVVAVAAVSVPLPEALAHPKLVRFSGYEWEVNQRPTDSGGIMHRNSVRQFLDR